MRLLLPLFLALAAGAAGESRALLVTVSRYRAGIENLPGIDKDLPRIREVAKLMGFTPANCRELANATTTEILDALEDWLIHGVSSSDSVLLYLSMHGSQTKDLDGDELDGQDELLVTADTTVYNRHLRNYLLDDHLNQRLAAIPARHTLVIIDTCHSGSMDKAAPQGGGRTNGWQVKNADLPGEPGEAGSTPFETDMRAEKGVTHEPRTFVVLAACQEKEKALTSPEQGSLFTMVLAQEARRMAREGRPLQLDEWFLQISSAMKDWNDSQHPLLKSERDKDRFDWFRAAGDRLH